MRVLKTDGTDPAVLASELTERIRSGGVAVVPTDTVYGLVCDARNEKAKERIYRIKGRPEAKPLIGFVPDMDSAGQYARIPSHFRPLVRRQWPGRSTFIFKAGVRIPRLVTPSGEIGLRVPACCLLLGVLTSSGMMASTSANPSASGSSSTIEAIPDSLKCAVDLVVDGGRLPGRESSVWNLTGDLPRLLRGTVLFVCEGNTCRSPMAETLFRHLLPDGSGRSIRTVSAGMTAFSFSDVSERAVRVMKELDMPVRPERSRPVTQALLREADYIVTMEEQHREALCRRIPEKEDRIVSLDIPDPAGEEISFYRRTRDTIREKLQDFMRERIGG